MIPVFLLKYSKEIGIAVLFVALGGMVYNKIVDHTTAKLTKEFQEQVEAFNTKLDARVLDLENLSKQLAIESDNKTAAFSKKIDTKLNSVLAATKDTPAFVLDTETKQCTASTIFVDNYNSLLLGIEND